MTNVGAAIAQFTVTLTAPATEPVSVPWSTTEGTALAGRDYATNSGTLVFALGETSKVIEVLVYGRTSETEDRVFYVQMAPPTNALLVDEIGACVIHVDTEGSEPVLSVIVPKGERGARGLSAYEVWLADGNVGTQTEFLESLKPDAAEFAAIVAPLIDAGIMEVTAAGTEAQPDTANLANFTGRIAYMRETKKAIAPALTAGVNVIPLAAFAGDAVDPTFYSGFQVIVMRAGAIAGVNWQYLPDSDEIRIEDGQAGDIPIALQQDIGTGDISKAPVLVGEITEQLQDWIAGYLQFAEDVKNKTNPELGSAIMGHRGGTVAGRLDVEVSLDNYTAATNQQKFAAALGDINSKGGGTLLVPGREYIFSGTCSVVLSAPVEIKFIAGAKITQAFDVDAFDIVCTGQGSLDFSGHAESTSTFPAKSLSSSIFKVRGSGKLKDVVFSGVFLHTAPENGISQFKYGLHLIGCQEPMLSGFRFSGSPAQADHHSTVVRLVNGGSQASTNIKLYGVSGYNILVGAEIVSTANPGVEGIKLVSCDFVNCQTGVTADASASGYAPPQFEFEGTHINSYGPCAILKGMLNIKQIGGLLYRFGVGTTEPFLILEDCQDVALLGVTLHTITAGLQIPAIKVKGSVGQPAAFVRLDGCHFWLNDSADAILVLEGSFSKVVIGPTNTKTTNGAWFDSSLVTSGLDTLEISPDLPKGPNDTALFSATVSGGVLDLRNSTVPNILLTGVTAGTVITSILARKGWQYNIRSDVAGVSYTPSASIEFAGVSGNVPYTTAGSIMTFIALVSTGVRYVGSSVATALRQPVQPVQVTEHPTGSLPDPAANTNAVIMVTGIGAYRIQAYSDGSAWRRSDDNAVTVT